MRDTFLCECFAFCCSYTKEALMQNAKLLELNPEFYTAWNFRKRAVQHLLSSETDEEARKRISKEELDLVFIHFHCIVYFLHKIPKGLISYISIALQQLGLLSSKTRKSSLLHNIKCLGICNHASSSLSVCVFFAGVQSLEGKPQVIWCMAPPQMGDCIGSLSIGLRIHSLVKGAQIGCPQFSQLELSKVLSLSLSLSLSHTHTHTLFVNIFVPPKIV
jgi:hypothetical protein